MNIQINPKHEEWKYSPKNPLEFSKGNTPVTKDILVGLGPSPEKLQTLSIEDLAQDGYLEITPSFKESPTPLIEKATQRAKVHKFFDPVFLRSKETIKIIKRLPSTLWLSHQNIQSYLKFEIDPAIQLNLCVVETDQDQISPTGLDFSVKENATLNLGIHLTNSKKTYLLCSGTLFKDATVNAYSLLSGSADYKRLDTNFYLLEDNSSAILNGASVCKNSSVFDFHSNLFLLGKEQTCYQDYKTLNLDKARSIFGGRIHICENSSGAKAEQINNNLLLSKKSAVDTQPELNIFHDNVMASHGATSSTLDEEQFFYFLSRGLSEEQSNQLLLNAFLKSTLGKITSSEIKNYFTEALLGTIYEK